MGDRHSFLKKAKQMLTQQMNLVRESTIYQTAAWGGSSEGQYLNQVLVMETTFQAVDCLNFILKIENQLGRKRVLKWGDRTMDIDILYYDDEIIASERLKVPHPHMASRNFVLVPLAEILPEHVHPQLKKDSIALMKECKDSLSVKPWNALA